ncbi:MAG: EF-hand domain-containing protein [Planctomycetia bacterium]|nr:EF-hand domain-containing protein [Planctomycetia bacterium]
MVKSIALVALVAAVCLISIAQADDQPAQNAADPAAMFAQLDTNQDGQLTSDEIPAEKKRLFERLLRLADKNGDGKLSRDEFTAGIQRKPERPDAAKTAGDAGERPSPEEMFKRLDANGDGKVTLDEVPEPRKAMFKGLLAHADKDGDGALAEQEFIQGLQALRGQHVGKPGNEKRPEGGPRPEQVFRRLDKNGDGKLTLDEVPEERRPMFERIFRRADKDGDKVLTLEEFIAGFRGGQQPPPGAKQPEVIGAQALPRGGLFQALDTDHDGKLSSAEISAASEVLKKLDKNDDGTITIDELMSAGPEQGRK